MSQPNLDPWEGGRENHPESPFQTHDGQSGSDQHKFMRRKSCHKNLKSFYGAMTTVLSVLSVQYSSISG